MTFSEFAQFGHTEITNGFNFRIYKNRYDWYAMCVPVGFGDIVSIMWQGANLIVRTDRGVTFIFDNFYSFYRI